MILVKNSKLLLCVLFFEKGLDMYFYVVVYKSRRLVRLLKCYFDLVKNFAFYHDFWSKIQNFFLFCFSLK